MTTELEAVLAEMRTIRHELDRINKSIAELRPALRVETRAVSTKEAAKLLSIGLTKMRQLIKNGTVLMVDVGSRRMVPMNEIERLTTPKQEAPKAMGGRRPRKHSESSADLKEWLKKQR